MQHCKRCLMPDTRPGSIFKDGICQACYNYESRSAVNWDKRLKELRELCDKYRKSDGSYDCVIPVSGGKDSHFLAHIMVEEMHMHPLLVTVTDSFTHSQAGSHNLRNMIETFKLNHYLYTINHDLFKRATRIAFETTGEALKFVEYAIYTIPTLVAQKFDISLVVFGENSSFEYGTTSKNFFDASPIVKTMSDTLEKDRQWWIEHGLSSAEVGSIQLDKNKPLPLVIYMSYFIPWSSVRNLEVAKRYGFRTLAHEWEREGCVENFEQMDSFAYLVHLWLKYPKFGFQRTSDIVSRRLREGRLTIEEAKQLIKEKDHKLDQKAMIDFISFLGYTQKEFWEITDKLWNREIFEQKEGEWILKNPPY
ncbi:MAG: N-acetyl sugar amidotransferase [Candidatus Thorarchaeota archaeon]|nr:N-acetyl sugar amidotransferase [Candidatus Thorarchaeota archaeon]